MKLPKISIQDDERVIFVGTTGFGKTVLAKHFLAGMNRVLVIDPKHTFRMDGFKRSKKLPTFRGKEDDFHVIYRPAWEDDNDLAHLCAKLNKMKGCTIYCDELATLSEQFPQSTSILADIARTGRERHVALWSSVQRPRWTPRVFFTETEVYFQFNLRSSEDRAYMAQFTGAQTIDPLDYFRFWYSRVSDPEPYLMKLDINKGGIMLV
jgi:hypothetical protein